jgi:hypothetical protein
MSAVATLLQIFTEPGKAMAAVRERSMIWLPILLLVLGNAALQLWYWQIVDIGWVQDYMLSANPELTPEQINASRGFMSRGVMSGISAVSIAIVLPVILLISAVYYLLAAKVVGNDIDFGKWFAFSAWTAVPTLLLIPLGAVQILLSDNGQLTPEALNPLSLNQLLFHFPSSNPWAGLLNAISLPSIWSTVVAVIGYRRWTDKPLGTSLFVVLLPQLVIYGCWAAFAAMRSA